MSPLNNTNGNQFVQAAVQRTGADHIPLPSVNGVGESVIIQAPQGLDQEPKESLEFQMPGRPSVEQLIKENAAIPDLTAPQVIQHAGPGATVESGSQSLPLARKPLQFELGSADANPIRSAENLAPVEQASPRPISLTEPDINQEEAVAEQVMNETANAPATNPAPENPTPTPDATAPTKLPKLPHMHLSLAGIFDSSHGNDLHAAKKALQKESQG